MKTVAVIMSTYNGEKYLREQIDSILAQEGVNVELYIRDDGSQDGTRKIIADYVSRCGNVHADFGENVGAGRSFIEALISAPEYEYYAFSDQDDFWLPEKLSSAVSFIRQKELPDDIPVVYYANAHVADSKLNILRTTEKHKFTQTLGSEIVKRRVLGCTMLINAKMREILKSRPITDDMLSRFHDSLIISLVYSLGGIVMCDPGAYILYRQHGTNSTGSPVGIIARIKGEISTLRQYHGDEGKIARGILDVWGDVLDPAARDFLELVADYRKNFRTRLKVAFSPKFRTGDWRLSVFWKAKSLLGLM